MAALAIPVVVEGVEAAAVAFEGAEAAAGIAGATEAGEAALVAGEMGETTVAAAEGEAVVAEEVGSTVAQTAGRSLVKEGLIQGATFTAAGTAISGASTLFGRLKNMISGGTAVYSAQQIDDSNKVGTILVVMGIAAYFYYKRR
jgi:hypothetical protein